ncbi:hypothetical protein HPP92_009626 [Vanilla planifolia]|uniref:Uncharacterized protein n=1 Tax=Vanilla planifolia TaxID=51239 RepID=A0A835RE97_VANPL|nr:hypothetical protein HPP92_009626 [Vanilla planifolia]
MDETMIIDDAKEKLCFVSLDVLHDLQPHSLALFPLFLMTIPFIANLVQEIRKDNPFRCTYVLPDGITHTRGFVKDVDEAQRFLSLTDGCCNDLSGMQEFNLTNERFLVPEMIFCPADLGMNQAGLAECIVRAIHSCHPHLHPVLFERIILTGGSTLFPRFAERLPIKGVWRGGSLLASSPDFESMCITKLEYEELGSTRCRVGSFTNCLNNGWMPSIPSRLHMSQRKAVIDSHMIHMIGAKSSWFCTLWNCSEYLYRNAFTR